MSSSLIFVFVLVGCVSHCLAIRLQDVPDGMIATPHGIRPQQCVHQVKHDDHILRPLAGGVQVEYPSLNLIEFHPELPECVANMRELAQAQAQSRAQVMPSSESSPANGGWEIDGGWYTASQMGNFSALYVVPDENPVNDGQILYYFIGMQDNADNNLTIIQPVVAYCPRGCGFSYTQGWTMASWNCCPSGETWYGSGVQLSQGVTVDTYCDSTGSDAYIYCSYNGHKSVLNIAGDYRRFNWACVTGEFYDYKGCQDFNTKPFTFRNLKLTAMNGANQSPQWSINNNIKNCGASLTFSGQDATMIGQS